MSARPASSVRRGSATMSRARFSCARFSAAPKTGCDSVVSAPAMKMTSHACSVSRRDPAPALCLDRAPWAGAPLGALLSVPHPAPSPFLPAPSYQRLGEPVAMLREVVPEPPLHAGGPLVGCVQLDVGGGDAHDMVVGNVEVDLATYAAIRTNRAHHLLRMPDLLGREPLPRHHLEDRAGGTDADALAAPRTPRLVRVAVGADDDFGVLAAVSDVEHAYDLNVLARAHAAGAEDAGGHVVTDHRVARALVARAQGEVARLDRRRHDVVLHEVTLELVARVGPATVAEMIGGIALGEQTEHALAVFHRRVGLRGDHHPVGDFGGAGRNQLALALNRNQADAAVADGGEFGIPTERRDLDAGGSGGVANGLPVRCA